MRMINISNVFPVVTNLAVGLVPILVEVMSLTG